MENLERIIPWIISIISVVMAWRAIKSSENIARFNVYFSAKAQAYNNFIEQMGLIMLNSSASIEPFAVANYQAAIYASDEVRAALLSFSIQIAECSRIGEPPSSVDINPLLNAMQKDLESSWKFSSRCP